MPFLTGVSLTSLFVFKIPTCTKMMRNKTFVSSEKGFKWEKQFEKPISGSIWYNTTNVNPQPVALHYMLPWATGSLYSHK